MKLKTAFKLMWLWPPYLGSGISVKEMNEDLTRIVVQLKHRWWSQNYVGTQYGGSLFSMTDPFYMLMLLEHLGKQYIVWDKAGGIRYKKPGKGIVYATFELSKEKIAEIKKAADENPKTEPMFLVEIKDIEGNVVAEVDRLVYVKRKDKVKKT
jgi:hypothetical protein